MSGPLLLKDRGGAVHGPAKRTVFGYAEQVARALPGFRDRAGSPQSRITSPTPMPITTDNWTMLQVPRRQLRRLVEARRG